MRGRRSEARLVVGLLAGCLLLALSGRAAAQDPEAGLADAQARAAAASAEIRELEAAAKPARSRFEAANRRAAPVRARLRDASARVASVEASLRRRHRQAAASVQRIDAERREASEEHDEAVRAGIGLGIAALVMAALALAWGQFRGSAAVAQLARIEVGQAIGLCVGAGLVAVIVGAVLGSVEGIVGAIGYAILALGFALPVAFVLARHSVAVERGHSRPRLRREPLPARATQVIAGLFAALFLLCLGSAVFAGEAKSGDVGARVRAEAEEHALSSPALAAAKSERRGLEAKARIVLAAVHRRQADLRAAKGRLVHAESRLANAEADERRFSARLAAIERHEVEEREREEREAEKRAEAEEREFEEQAQEEEEIAAEQCDPSYSGCLDPNAVDYDCEGGSGDGPLYTGTVEVLGIDHYGLDDDGDGIGCDP